jgi:hypothetical protein
MAKDEPKDIETRFAELAERNRQLMEMLETKLKADNPSAFTPQVLEDILTRSSAAAAKSAGKATEVLVSKMKPENADHLHLGPFEHPEGGIKHPKPQLQRETASSLSGRMRIDDLTYTEVLAVNALNASLARGQRRSCRNGKWIAQVSDDDQRLDIRIPVKSIDDRGDLPPFLQIMQELTTGERALDVGELANELALLRQQMAELRAGVAA